MLAGRDKKLGTKDDKAVALASASYDAKKLTVTLIPAKSITLTQREQLRITAARITDSFGRSLDGNRDGTPGGDFTANFRKGSVQTAN